MDLPSNVVALTTRKSKGDFAEWMVGTDLLRRGYRIALPYGEDWDYDLIVDRVGVLERVQVKYTCSEGDFVGVKCFSHSLTNGKVRRTKHYTSATVDWIAVYDATTDACSYVPSSEFRDGRSYLHLRLKPARNNQKSGIRWAANYREI